MHFQSNKCKRVRDFINRVRLNKIYNYFQLMILKAITLLLLAVCTFSVQIQPKNTQGLGFHDMTEYFSSEFITLFRNLINSGSSFYRNDTQKKLEYISDGLNKNNPIANRLYSVFMENETVTQENESGWYVRNYRTIASLAKGVDVINPNLSYMLSVEYTWNRTFISEVGQKGVGLRSYQEQLITDQIVSFESENPHFCACHVGEYLRQTIHQDYNHFCSDIPNRHAVSAYVFDNKFIYFKPARCYHLLYLKYPGLEK